MSYEYGPYRKTSIKLNYNCPESEKSGTGPGSCKGTDNSNRSSEKTSFGFPVRPDDDIRDRIKDLDKNQVLTSEPEIGYSKRIGIIDKNNIIHSTESGKALAKAYINKEKGNGEEFYSNYEKVGNHSEPFDGSVFKEKNSDKYFLIHEEDSGKGFGQKIHYISEIKRRK